MVRFGREGHVEQDDLQPLRPMAGAGGSDQVEPPPHAAAVVPPAASTSGWLDDRSRTTVSVNLASIMERVDEQLLPALYRFVGRSFKADPAQLGTLTFSRAVVQALASPLAGVLGHYVNRVHVITAGAALWGLMCMLFSTTNSVSQGIPFWAVNGIGLSLLIPAAQSMIADYNIAERRGRAFGLLHLTGAVGALLGSLYATNIGATHPLGIEGWRFAFMTVAVSSWLIGACAFFFAVDPRFSVQYKVDKAADMHAPSWRSTLSEVWSVVTIPTFLIIVLQGVLGTMPWNSLVFLTFYFQLLGMSDLQSSLLMAVFLATNAAGGLIGGLLGDWAARRWPNHGRIFVCQFSVGIGVPLSVLLFKGLPLHAGAGAVALYAVVLSATGLTITWAATACNNPIFAEIVPTHLRNLVFAFDRSFEGAIAALGAPLVGWLAKVAFGFSGTAEVSATDLASNSAKAHSLGSAMLVFTALPWALCALFFSGLHWSFPRDKRRAERAAAEAHAAALAAALAEEPAVIELVVGHSVSQAEKQPLTDQDGAVNST